MIQATEHLYIQILNSEPIIKGTRAPVRAIVVGIAPEEIPQRLPHLTVN